MGSTTLAGVREMLDEDQALRWHLESNHYPPLSDPRHLASAKKAIELGRDGQFDEPVEVLLTSAFNFDDFESKMGRPMTEEEKAETFCLTHPDSGKKVTAGELIEAWHLGDFLNEEGE